MTRLAAAALIVMTGCWSMAPKYERPAAPIPAQLPGGDGSATAADVPIADFVHDDKLRQILSKVITENRSLRRTAMDIESARAQYRIQRAARLPDVEASANVLQASEFIGIPGAETARVSEYDVGVGVASWEIDLFGRIKSLSDAKLQSYLSAVEVGRATRVSLIAEAATAYVTLAADKSRLAIAQSTMAAAQKAKDLTEQLVGGGTSNRGDFWQASTVFEQARGDVAALTATIAQDRNALELLAGGPLDDALMPDALPPQPDWFADVPVGMSSTVLLARPDVLAAEHELIAANANIGAARAAFFPTLSLTANGGLVSTALAALFTGPTFVWTIAPSLSVPLFRGGANRANLEYAEAQKKGLIAGYELAIQTAFREVADALATRGTIKDQMSAQAALVEAASKSLELAQARYTAGVEPFLSTLVSQRALYAAQNSLVTTQYAAMTNRITLYRVLGGGADR
nr:efflux transporter outer membrane subunit [Kofleriaceae bacterium]